MNMYVKERALHIERENKRFHEVNRVKRALALSVLSRIHEEWEENPDANLIRADLRRPLDGVARRILSHHPEAVSNRLNIGRTVLLHLDESVEPPILEICLGECPDDEE